MLFQMGEKLDILRYFSVYCDEENAHDILQADRILRKTLKSLHFQV